MAAKKQAKKKKVAKKQAVKKVKSTKPASKKKVGVKKAPVPKEKNHVKEVKKVDAPSIKEADKELTTNNRGIFSPFEDQKYQNYLSDLDKLRRDGENKVNALHDEIRDIKLNKQIDRETKKILVSQNNAELNKATVIKRDNQKAVKEIVSKATLESKNEYKNYFIAVKKQKRDEIVEAKRFYREMVKKIKAEHAAKVKEIRSHRRENHAEYKVNLKAENIAYSARMNEAKTAKNDSIDSAKQFKYDSFMNKYGYNSKLRNDKHTFKEWLQFKKETYVANFDATNWLIKNAIYIIIILIFAALIIVSGVRCANSDEGMTNFLLYGPNILAALTQIAPKIFFALGAAGLILLGGTDLSIGRLTGVGVSFSLMILASTTFTDNFGNVWFNLTGAPAAVKIIVAILISITFCTFFTAFAGFFTAKFKMHPFISTLAVQLISFGFFQFFWSGTASFAVNGPIIDGARGPNGAFLIIYAVVAIAAIWFIWNKTRFGKHMYAVGGNQEAASVSGISPFAVTLGAFILAGILYGLGGFVQAIQVGTGNFNTGYGTETDAIAACVIGGISFSGGVGKVGGAVIGAVILGFLTYAFGNLGINANLQLLIKGLIILVAVALDCVKYLRKK